MHNDFVCKCPECGQPCDVLPDSPGIPWSVTTTQTSDYTGTYQPIKQSETFKCVDPHCWVTKVRVEWS